MNKSYLVFFSLFFTCITYGQWIKHPISNAHGLVSCSDDFDNDGDIDYLYYVQTPNTINVLENLGSGNFLNTAHINGLTTAPLIISSITSAEINNDNLKDIVVTFSGTNSLQSYVFVNNGNFQFQQSTLVFSNTSQGTMHRLQVHDLNFDGYDDLVIHKDSSLFSGDEYNEAWVLTNTQSLTFNATLLSGGIYNEAISVVDKDMDNDLDILFGTEWFENQNGSFAANNIEAHLFGTPMHNLQTTNTTGEFNGDNYHDLLFFSGSISWFGSFSGQYYDTAQVVLYPGNAQGGYEYILADTFYIHAYSDLHLQDIDQDGDIDIFTYMKFVDGGITRWYENDGTGSFSHHLIHSYQNDDQGTTYGIEFKDIDQNGFLDPIFCGGGEFGGHYFPNDNGNFQRPVSLFHFGGLLSDFHLADLDNNNELDIISTTYEGLAFSSSFNQNANFGYQHTYLSWINNVHYPFECESLDFDNDGDKDVFIIAAIGFDFHLFQLENNNGLLSPGLILDTCTQKMRALKIVDWNLDGLLDIMYIIENVAVAPNWMYESAVVVQKNNGNGTFTKEVLINESAANDYETPDFDIGDLDDDGDNDIVLCDTRFNNIRWFKNNGAGFTQLSVYGAYSLNIYPKSVSIEKIDNNNTLDVVANYYYISPNLYDLQVYAYFNDGTGTFTNDQYIDHYWRANHQVSDFDNDGDMDIIFSDQQDNFQWYINDGTGNFTTNELITQFGSTLFNLGDINSDNIIDVVAITTDTTNYGFHWYEGGTSTLSLVEQNSESSQLIIYPNPGNNVVNILADDYIETLDIYTIEGKLAYSESFNSEQKQVLIDPNLSKGSYIIKIKTDSGVLTEKYLRY